MAPNMLSTSPMEEQEYVAKVASPKVEYRIGPPILADALGLGSPLPTLDADVLGGSRTTMTATPSYMQNAEYFAAAPTSPMNTLANALSVDFGSPVEYMNVPIGNTVEYV